MAPSATYTSVVKLSGTTTAFTNEATTAVSAGTVYQITNTSKRIVDPDVAITVKDGGVTVAATLYTFDYLFGIVTFSGYSAAGAVTVDGSYLPTHTVTDARMSSVSMQVGLVDSTSYDSASASSGSKRFTPTLKTASGEVEILDILQTDLDAGAGSVVIETLADGRTPVLLEQALGSSGKYFRAWVLFEGLDRALSVEDLANKKVKWRATAKVGSGQTEGASFGIGS